MHVFFDAAQTFSNDGVMFALTSRRAIEYQPTVRVERLSNKDVSRGSTAAAMHNLMTVKETAEYLRIPLPTVYYLVQRGQLPAVQIGGRWRIKRSLLDRDVLRKGEESGQPTVLVVDDDPALQALFKQFLKK